MEQPVHAAECGDAANGKPYAEVLKVVDEHLETIKMLYSKTYDGLVERVRQLG